MKMYRITHTVSNPERAVDPMTQYALVPADSTPMRAQRDFQAANPGREAVDIERVEVREYRVQLVTVPADMLLDNVIPDDDEVKLQLEQALLNNAADDPRNEFGIVDAIVTRMEVV